MDKHKIEEIKELTKRCMFFPSENDVEYIAEHLEDMCHTIYFVFDEYEKMKELMNNCQNVEELFKAVKDLPIEC